MSELLRATIALQDDSIRMLDDKLEAKDAEIERLTFIVARQTEANSDLHDRIAELEDAINCVLPYHAHISSFVMNKLHKALANSEVET